MHQDYLKVLTRENAELGYGEVSGSGVNLRSGPSTTYGKVAVASSGEKCYILGLNNGWYKVIYNGSICYIRSDYLSLTEIPYENQASPNSPKFYRLGKSTGRCPQRRCAERHRVRGKLRLCGFFFGLFFRQFRTCR